MFRINRQDEIVLANDECLRFSFDDGAMCFEQETVLHKRLWDFIADDLTRELYELVLRLARSGDTISLSFRCDFADCRRLLELSVSGISNGDVLFETKALCRLDTEMQPLPDLQTVRGGEKFLRICGWCKRLDVGVSHWSELEIAMTKLKMFESDCLPHLTHGICNSCFVTMSEKLVRKRLPESPANN